MAGSITKPTRDIVQPCHDGLDKQRRLEVLVLVLACVDRGRDDVEVDRRETMEGKVLATRAEDEVERCQGSASKTCQKFTQSEAYKTLAL